MNRRAFTFLALPLLAGCVTEAGIESSHEEASDRLAAEPYPVRAVNRRRFDARFRPTTVAMNSPGKPGSIIVDTEAKQLFFFETETSARRYGVAVGATGHAWKGQASVGRKAKWPAWYPTDDMHAQAPGLPNRIEPGPSNPLGARALYLFQDGRDTLYRVHGTSEPWTIGTEASSGCIRMINEDIIDLFDRVDVGATVVVS